MFDRDEFEKFLLWQIRRSMINQAKDTLIVFEDLKQDNVISEEYYSRLRSRILGQTNDKIRDLSDVITNFITAKLPKD